ncbi:MAG: hypothetical protein HGA85_09160 [Nanoarchaeota archaeon]|nr:hypothetical protein [Nanoarchaeota archaeon]
MLPMLRPDRPFNYEGGVFPAGEYSPNIDSIESGIAEMHALQSHIDGKPVSDYLASLRTGEEADGIIQVMAMGRLRQYEFLLNNSYSLVDIAILNQTLLPIDSIDGGILEKRTEMFYFDKRTIIDGNYHPENGNLVIRNLIDLVSERHGLLCISSFSKPQIIERFIAENPGDYVSAGYHKAGVMAMHSRDQKRDGAEIVYMSNGTNELVIEKREKWFSSNIYYLTQEEHKTPMRIFRAGHMWGQAYDETPIVQDRHMCSFSFDSTSHDGFFIVTYTLAELVENVIGNRKPADDQMQRPKALEG